jgi:hypothetical protein
VEHVARKQDVGQLKRRVRQRRQFRAMNRLAGFDARAAGARLHPAEDHVSA